MILFLEKSRDIWKAVAKIPVLYHVGLLAFAEATQLSSGYFSGKCFHATTVPSRQSACLEIGGHAFSERISISIFMLKNRAACKKNIRAAASCIFSENHAGVAGGGLVF